MTREQCNNLAKLISSIWKDVARKLLFSKHDISSIEADHPRNQSREMLYMWLDREGSEGTIFILCKALIDSKVRDHAENVFGDDLVKSVIKLLSLAEA